MPTVALFLWPVVTAVLFKTLAFRPAVIWSLLAGYLLLPERFAIDLPAVPPIDKTSILALSVGLAVLMSGSDDERSGKRADRMEYPRVSTLIVGFFVLLLMTSVATVWTNQQPLSYGPLVVPATRPWDLVSNISALVFIVIPYFVGRAYLARPMDHRLLLHALVAAGLAYSLLMLIEIRLSPQLHKWVYGYHQHSFAQHVRDGYRPKVFLDHGLSVGLFVFTVVIAAGALYRSADPKSRSRWLIAALWMFAILSISENLGAFALGCLFLPILWLNRLWQARIAAAVGIIFLLYPVARQANLVPIDWIETQAIKVSEDRAASFMTRIRNEGELLERAGEKPLVGWGGWGRNRIYDDFGNDLSVTDGLWIIQLGTNGWLGYIGFFGLLTLPVLLLPRRARDGPLPAETVAMSLILAGNFIYLIPNSTLSPVAWLMAGALVGYVQAPSTVRKSETVTQERRRPVRYSRFEPQVSSAQRGEVS